MRNGFSHADSSKILADLPEEMEIYQGRFAASGKLERKVIKQKSIPFFQAIHIENFAKENANDYFDFVFQLLFKIEERLKEKHQ